MLLARCDFCCNVLEDINGGVVYNCNTKVKEETYNEHICEDCLNSHQDELELYEDDCNNRKYVRFIDEENNKTGTK